MIGEAVIRERNLQLLVNAKAARAGQATDDSFDSFVAELKQLIGREK